MPLHCGQVVGMGKKIPGPGPVSILWADMGLCAGSGWVQESETKRGSGTPFTRAGSIIRIRRIEKGQDHAFCQGLHSVLQSLPVEPFFDLFQIILQFGAVAALPEW